MNWREAAQGPITKKVTWFYLHAGTYRHVSIYCIFWGLGNGPMPYKHEFEFTL